MRSQTIACVVGMVGLWAACTIEQPQPHLQGEDVRLTIIHTSDIHSRLFPYNFVPNKFDQDFGLLPGNGPYGGSPRIAAPGKRDRRTSGRSVWAPPRGGWGGAPGVHALKRGGPGRAASPAREGGAGG